MGRPDIRHTTWLILAFWLVPAAASGTTFVLMDQAQMFAASDAVIVGTVTAIESAVSKPDGPVNTYVHVEPDLVIKGDIGTGPIVLREPGGSVGGRSEWVFGAPEFWTGERSLLFLSRNADGDLQTTNLSMGKYMLSIDAVGTLNAVRHFGYGASVFVPETGRLLEAQPETQPLAPLLERLRAQARAEASNRPRHAPPVQPLIVSAPKLPADTITEHHEAFTLLGSPPGRWFEPDSGLPVRFLVDANGDDSLGPAASRDAVDAALAAWTNVPTAALVLEDAGSAAPAPWRGCGASEVSFNDPGNEISQPHNCGGILAIGGFCTGTETTVVNGRRFAQITSGKVVFNDGWGGCSFWNVCNVSETAAHEIGHAIGLGHSSDHSATMSAIAHYDGRCANLASDDVAGVSFIYPLGGAPPPATRTASQTLIPGAATPTPFPPSTEGPTTVPATPRPTDPPVALTSCTGAKKVQVGWAAKDPFVAQVFVSATKCPPPLHCDTPDVGGLMTAAPATLKITDASNGALAIAINSRGSHRGGCPSGKDIYQEGSNRLRLIFGANGETTLLTKVSVPQAAAGPFTLGMPLTFTLRDASGYGVEVSTTTCITHQSAKKAEIRCF